jgi:exonuclease SbcC
MKTITINRLTLVNFKGIKNLTVDFNLGTFEVKGQNETGKTTIMDAFLWLLFGKDSTDRKDFEIKTLDKNNKAIPKLDHEVNGILDVDGHTVNLKRCFREKWTKRRGAEETEITGNETLFYVDEVPYQAGQYGEKINSIIDELVFKMVTSPHYFNSMKWQDRRAVLINLAGEITDAEIGKLTPDFTDLLKELSGKSFDEFRRSIAEKKKRLKDDLAQIPARVDEVNRSLPVEPDYAELDLKMIKVKSELADTDEQITNSLKLSEAVLKQEQEKQQSLYKLRGRLKKIEFDATEKVSSGSRERDSELNRLRDELAENERLQSSHVSTCKSNGLKIEYTEKKMDELREKWNAENSKQLIFNESEFTCPACKRPYEPDDVDTQKQAMTANFNRSKLEKCAAIQKEGMELSEQVKQLTVDTATRHTHITELTDKATELGAKIKELSVAGAGSDAGINLSDHPEIQAIKNQITDLEAHQYTAPDTSVLQSLKAELQTRIADINNHLSVKQRIEDGKNRIKVLEAETREKSQQLADLEKQEFIMTEFERVKMNRVESQVNKMFSLVQFKMFNQLINGGIEPCCDTLINGVPWPDANSASRTNGGIDIINTLSGYYQVSAPIWIDNNESVNRLCDTQSQVIKLTVTTDKTLKFDKVLLTETLANQD